MKSQIDLTKQSIKSLEYQYYGFRELMRIRGLFEAAKHFYEIDKSLDRTYINIIDNSLTMLIYLYKTTGFEDAFNRSKINEKEILIDLKNVLRIYKGRLHK